MTIKEFSEFLYQLETTSKRLAMTDILVELLKAFDEKEIQNGINLALGQLYANYRTPQFNVAEKLMLKAISQSTGISEEIVSNKYQELGDLGNTIYELKIKSLLNISEIDVNGVHKVLEEIANLGGAGSVDAKVQKISWLLQQVDALSAKYVARIILGTTRLGFTELTIVEALVLYLNGKKDSDLKQLIEDKYNSFPDIAFVAQEIISKGKACLDAISMQTGVPVNPQKAQRVKNFQEAIERIPNAVVEYKFDGTRVQLHLDRNKRLVENDLTTKSLFESVSEERILIKTFTRNLEDTTHMFPEVILAAEKYIDASSVILDGEVIAFDPDTNEFLPFQEVMQRKRKHNIGETAKNIPVKYFIFDILYKDGEELIKLSLTERKKVLNNLLKENEILINTSWVNVSTNSELTEAFEEAREKGLEGLIVKSPDANYVAGARSYAWIKLKVADEKLLADSVDCVVLGYYLGKGQRNVLGIGGFLAGVYDESDGTFKSITKVGTGLTEDDWRYLKKVCDEIKVDIQPENVVINKTYTPDVWVLPKIVVELGADEATISKTHTAFYALRFPRLIKFRPDKNIKGVTTILEINQMYTMQKRGYY